MHIRAHLYVCTYIHNYNQLSSFLLMCLWLQDWPLCTGQYQRGPNSPPSRHLLPVVLFMVRPLKLCPPRPIHINIYDITLMLSLLGSCLCSHFQEKLFHSWLPGIMVLTLFPPPLLWCSRSLRHRSYTVDVSVGARLPMICWPLHRIQLRFSVMVPLGIRIRCRMECKELCWSRKVVVIESFLRSVTD